MKVRQYSLPVLQNLLKRDPSAYAEEFEAIWRQYLSEVEVFKLAGVVTAAGGAREAGKTRLGELATFLAHTAKHYAGARERFAPGLVALLRDRAESLEPDLRLTLAQCCLLARSKGLLDPVRAMDLALDLTRRVDDKKLRRLLATAVVNDCRRTHRAGDGPLLRKFQKVLFAASADAATDGSRRSAKVALDAVVELYGRGVWVDGPTVNAVGRCCVDERARVACTAIHFFLGIDRAPVLEELDSDDDEGARSQLVKKARSEIDVHKHSKKTRKRVGDVKKAMKKAKKLSLKKADVPRPVFPAIQLLDDPHRLCELLLARLRAQKDKFEIRLAMMDFVSRVACAHKLQILPFYSYMHRYLAAHQKEAPKLLAVFAQACHDLVPPDEIVAACRKVADAFVSERNAPEAMALGINCLSEVVRRCPAVLEEPEMLGFTRDLAAYAKHRDKSVVISARSWIGVVRDHYPALLHKRDRGRAGATSTRAPKKFGQDDAGGVAGESLLLAYERGDLPDDFEDAAAECDAVGDGAGLDDGWVDVADDGASDAMDEEEDGGGGSDAMEEEEEEADGASGDGWEEEEEADAEDGGSDGWVDVDGDADGDADKAKRVRFAGEADLPAEAAAPAAARLLSSDDFARIRLLKARAAELKSGGRGGSGFLSGDDLVPEGVKRKTSVEQRKAQAILDRVTFEGGGHAGGKTNTEKRRTKNYLMVQKKLSRVNGLKKRKVGGAPPKQQLKREKRKRRRL